MPEGLVKSMCHCNSGCGDMFHRNGFFFAIVIIVFILLLQNWGPVSYTHLDVYKRQQVQAFSITRKSLPTPCLAMANMFR